MGDWGIKISLPGKSISSTEPRDYVFSSKYSAVKVAQEPPSKAIQTVAVSASSSSTVTVAHNLGFIPLFMVFSEQSQGSGKFYSGPAINAPDDTEEVYLAPLIGGVGTYADTTNIYLKFTNITGSSRNIRYYYFIFADDGV